MPQLLALLSAYVIWNLDPVIADLAGFELRWYGLLFTGGIVVSYRVVRKNFRQAGLLDTLFDSLAVALLVGMLVGMRLGHFLFYEPLALVERPLEVLLPVSFSPEFRLVGYQGLASHGGVIGLLLAVGWFVRRHNSVSKAFVLNQLATAVPLAGGFIRLGNLMNSEIVGQPAGVPWAFVFVSVDALPRHPTQLYEALGYFAIFGLLYGWRQRGTFRPPMRLFGLALILLAGWRFLMEFFKADQVAFEQALWLNMGQWLSLPFVIAGVVILFSFRRQ